jgi:hypothetical protein
MCAYLPPHQHTGGKQFSRRAFQGPEGGTPPTSVVVVSGDEGPDDENQPKGVWEPELEHSRGTVMFRTCSQESSSMYTVSHLTAMTAVAMMAEAVTPGCLGGAAALAALPTAATVALALEPQVAALAREWHDNSTAGGEIVALGAGPHEPSAHEVEIKIGEAARVRCKGYAVEQYLLRKTKHTTRVVCGLKRIADELNLRVRLETAQMC